MPTSYDNPYILISGKGRSGSNRLSDILDTSPHTICRSEVNEIPGSAFHGIGGELFAADFGPAALARLRGALADAGRHRSARDRLEHRDKAYLSGPGRVLVPLLSKTRLRRVLRGVGLLRNSEEWRLPALALNRAGLNEARLVLKLNSSPAWAAALADADKTCRILHNIREPLGYLQSWYNRFIAGGVGARSFEENFHDVPRLLAHFGRDDAARYRAPTEANLIAVELWRWRYINESLMALEARTGQYLRITYAEIETDPLGSAERIFAFADLAFGVREESRVRALRNDLFGTPHKTSLDIGLCESLIATVLDGSPLENLARGRAR